jgi:hypothetical protein
MSKVKNHLRAKHPRLYKTWLSMRRAVNGTKYKSYEFIGAHGIKIDPRFESFDTFVEYVGEPPESTMILGRKNLSRNFTPRNIVWLTRSEYDAKVKAYKADNPVISSAAKKPKVVSGKVKPSTTVVPKVKPASRSRAGLFGAHPKAANDSVLHDTVTVTDMAGTSSNGALPEHHPRTGIQSAEPMAYVPFSERLRAMEERNSGNVSAVDAMQTLLHLPVGTTSLLRTKINQSADGIEVTVCDDQGLPMAIFSYDRLMGSLNLKTR